MKYKHWENFEQEAFFRDLKITKIEWAVIATICTLRFTFSNGTSSIAFGNKCQVDHNFVVPDDVEIKRVEVSVRELKDGTTFLEAMKMHDSKG